MVWSLGRWASHAHISMDHPFAAEECTPHSFVAPRPIDCTTMESAAEHREPTWEEWENWRPLIKKLYVDEGRPLPIVRRELANQGFLVHSQ
jgi:Clr5 domain